MNDEKSKLEKWAEESSHLMYFDAEGKPKSAGCNFQNKAQKIDGALWLLAELEKFEQESGFQTYEGESVGMFSCSPNEKIKWSYQDGYAQGDREKVLKE